MAGQEDDDDTMYSCNLTCSLVVLAVALPAALGGILNLILGAFCLLGNDSSCAAGGFGNGFAMIVRGSLVGPLAALVTYGMIVYIVRVKLNVY